MKNFNWGTGIFLFYSLFAASLFFAVYQSTKHDNSLVVDNYYEEDIRYQSRYDQIQNSRSLEAGLVIQFEQGEKTIWLEFPPDKSGITGEVLLYRANNKSLDKRLPLRLNDKNSMAVPTGDLLQGRWKLEVEWESGGKSYFDKKTLTVPSA